MPESVRIDRQADGVGVLRIDRPPLNALLGSVLDEIAFAAHQLAGDPDVKAVVVLGGAKAFAAGAEERCHGERFDRLVAQVAARELDPYAAADELLQI